MKGFGFLLMLLLTGTATLLYLAAYGTTIFNPTAGMASIGGSMRLSMLGRKLKEKRDGADRYYNIGFQDYRPFDPVPSSTDYINTGPVEHGIPLMPYVPGPSPPPDSEQPKRHHFP